MLLYLCILFPVIALIFLDAIKKIDLTRFWHTVPFFFLVPHWFGGYLLFDGWAVRAGISGPGRFFTCAAVAVYILYCMGRILIFPFRRDESHNTRVRILFGGQVTLRCGVTALCMQILFYACLFPFVLGWNRPEIPWYMLLIDGVIALLTVLLPILTGWLVVLCTSRRLGVVQRSAILLLFWVPLLNLFFMYYLCRVARDEYDHECNRTDLQNIRTESQICRTRYPLLLVHGVGFRDLKYFNYWGRVPKLLIKNGAKVCYGHQEAWGTIEDNARAIQSKLIEILQETGCQKVNIIAHSKGGLDARYLITRLGMENSVASLTTLSTPHRGSELLDVLMRLPDSLYRKIARLLDRAFRKAGDRNPDAYTASRELSPAFVRTFNEQTPDSPKVYYQSFACVMRSPFSHLLLSIPNLLLKGKTHQQNDGLVCVDSARWENFRGVFQSKGLHGLSHGDMIDLKRQDYRGYDILEAYVQIVSELARMGF